MLIIDWTGQCNSLITAWCLLVGQSFTTAFPRMNVLVFFCIALTRHVEYYNIS